MKSTGRSWRIGIALAGLATGAGAQFWEVGNQLLVGPGGPAGQARFGSATAQGDFDGDGYDDLAVGAPYATENAMVSCGRVDLFRGGAAGLSPAPWHSVIGPAEMARFGHSLAAGDFDGDGRDELAIGVIGFDEEISGTSYDNSGRVETFEFEVSAWVVGPSFSQSGAVPGGTEANDRFGSSLATGDFDGNGYADLAVGVTGEAIGTVVNAGAVNVFYGDEGGLTIAGSQVWYRSGGGVAGTAEQDEGLGFSLAAGDFDGDDVDDLAIGAPFRTMGASLYSGSVVVLFGSSTGLVDDGQQEVDLVDLGAEPEFEDFFGFALAAGDFDFSIFCVASVSCADELAIGAPGRFVYESPAYLYGAGRVFVVAGSVATNGLDLGQVTSFDQKTLGPEGASAPDYGDQFGATLAAGSIDGGLGADLVVGAPGDEDTQGSVDALFGGSLALDGGARQFLDARPGLLSAPAATDDNFGESLAIGDFDGDGRSDLAIGIPSRNVPGQINVGAVQIVYGALFADGFERASTSAWVTN